MHVDPATLDAAVAKHAFTGVATVDVGDRRTLERCEGFVHRALAAPMTADTRIAIASGNKAFTALAVMRLVEEGRLRLDQPVRELLGDDLPLIDDAVDGRAPARPHLRHRRLPRRGGATGTSPTTCSRCRCTRSRRAAAFLPMLDGHPQKSPPGERFSYCNGGYMVLAVLLERVTGETYHEVVRRLVLAPAGLERTGFLPLNALPADAAAATCTTRATS